MAAKKLWVVHCMTGHYEDGRLFWDMADYMKTAVGTPTCFGRVLHAANLVRLDGGDLLVFVPKDVPELMSHAMAMARATPGIGDELLAVLQKAVINDFNWPGEENLSYDSRGECLRAVAYAAGKGYAIIDSVSTGWGHTLRCGALLFGEVQKRGAGLIVPSFAEAAFPGMAGRQSAVFDPPHLKTAPFVPENPAHEWDKLFPSVFGTFKGDKAKYQAFTDKVVAAMKELGVTHNITGEEL